MKRALFLAIAIDYFTRHPQSEECHITSDERVFHTIGSAKGFAENLKDNTIESFTREEAKTAEIETEAEDLTGTQGAGAGSDDGKPGELTLETFDPETAEYFPAKKLANDLGLSLESQNKDHVFAALVAAKAALVATNTEEVK